MSPADLTWIKDAPTTLTRSDEIEEFGRANSNPAHVGGPPQDVLDHLNRPTTVH
jgi:hypothetical protein